MEFAPDQLRAVSRVTRSLARCAATAPDPTPVRRLVHRLLGDPAASPGLGAAFGILARSDEDLAIEVEARVFGGPHGDVAWHAWLVWSNPVLPAARLLLPRYELQLDELEGEGKPHLPLPPLDPAVRCGVHLMLLTCLVPGEAPGAAVLSRRFLAQAPTHAVIAALQGVALAVSACLDAGPTARLDLVLQEASEDAAVGPDRAALLLRGPAAVARPWSWLSSSQTR